MRISTFLLMTAMVLSENTAFPAAETDFPRVDAVECRPRLGLPNFFGRLAAGDEVRIAYLGGSITEAQGWRPLSLKWFQEQFPAAKLREINAAISGTGSDFGVCRLDREVLQHHPDLLFVEFAVNDAGKKPEQIIQTMEGIVRKTWRSNPNTDICFVYTIESSVLPTIQQGKFQRTASAMERVADHYGIPSIHLGLEVAKLAGEGTLIFKGKQPKTEEERAAMAGKILFSEDGTHPLTESGHPFYLAAIVRSTPSLLGAGGAPGAHSLPEAIDSGNWEDAGMIPVTQVKQGGSWRKLDPAADVFLLKQVPRASGEYWVAERPGDSMSFRFKGKGFGLYSIKGPNVGQIAITVDGGQPIVATLFDSYCLAGRYRIRPWIYPGTLPEGEHTVTIEILPEQPDKAAILKQANVVVTDPKEFDGTAFYVSDILLRGKLSGEAP